MLIKKILNSSGLVTATVLNTKIREVENKIPNISSLVTKTVANTKISGVENKFIDYSKYNITQEFNKFTTKKFCIKIKTS